ncbi:unnamed protein product [Kuraishia capsulata CBS 1993]|uniref:HTH La-type RNA-binding domain-containing protein n=1 Tax=Kuraishia capsulata CBS 1993 TaxID=1382522 RepID=W6MKF7_9ASCO|nr:uncharacterized protein KUCA_T00002455001 [Kuraishia capsulata CBS 1993]CDK26483.1 unnamed protein product [Kuraishia capsulata CBS 1993]
MSSISYANAASGAPTKAEKSEIIADTTPVATSAVSPPVAAPAETPEGSEKPEKAETKPEAPKKNLAPAPVPEKNAWGTAPAAAPANSVSAPFQVSLGSSKPSAKITNGKEKWVPFKASVVLPTPSSGKSNGKPQNKSKAKKTPQGNGKPTDPKAPKPKSTKKPANGVAKSEEVKREEKKTTEEEQAQETTLEEQHSESQSLSSEPAESEQQHSDLQQHQLPQQHRNYKGTDFQPRQNGYKKYPRHGSNGTASHHHQNGFHHNGNHHHHQNGFHHNGVFQPQQPQAFVPHNGFMRFPQIPPQFMIPQPQHQQQQFFQEALFSLSRQIDYYFSTENLVKDIYLRKQMNSKGYIPLLKIASFNRVLALSGGDFNMVLTALSMCQNLETVGTEIIKLRTKFGYEKWVLPFDQREESGKDESVPETAPVVPVAAAEESAAETEEVANENI